MICDSLDTQRVAEKHKKKIKLHMFTNDKLGGMSFNHYKGEKFQPIEYNFTPVYLQEKLTGFLHSHNFIQPRHGIGQPGESCFKTESESNNTQTTLLSTYFCLKYPHIFPKNC